MSKIDEFLALTKTKVGCGYVLGAQGQIMTLELLNRLKYNYDESERETAYAHAKKWIGVQCFDCSGLVVWTLQQLGLLKANQDYTANGLYRNLCTKVDRKDIEPGDLCFHMNDNGHVTHVGIYLGNSRVRHARATSYGVVETGLLSTFNVFGRLTLLGVKWLDWKEILRKTVASPEEWEAAITVAVNAAKADGNLGALEIFKFLPTLIEKVYNNK